MQINQELLHKIKVSVKKNFDVYLQRILQTSTEHGAFGMDLLDSLHEQLPKTTCDNCGICCNSVSIFSLEYHRIIRDLMTRCDPERIRKFIFAALRFDLRQAEIDGQNRLRCTFRDDKTRICLIHPVRPFACRIFGLLKPDGTRDCERVKEFSITPKAFSADYLTELQARVLENSEQHEVIPGYGEIPFFPFEFWLYRYIFSPERAVQIYREILVPSSTPLTRLWEKPKKLPPIPEEYPET